MVCPPPRALPSVAGGVRVEKRENVACDLGAVGFIEQLVAGAAVQCEVHVAAARGQPAENAERSAPVVAHGIVTAGNEQGRQVAAISLVPSAAGNVTQDAHEVFVAVDGEIEIAVRVGVVGGDDSFVARQPGVRTFCVGNFLVVAPERQRADFLTACALATDVFDAADDPDELIHPRQGASGAAEDGGGQLLAVFFGIRAGEEAPHAVPEQEIGQFASVLSADLPGERVQVLYDILPAVFRREVAKIVHVAGAVAVTEVVVAADEVAVGGERCGKGAVAPEVFAHPVGDLDDAADIAVREEHFAGDGVLSVGAGECEFLRGRHDFLFLSCMWGGFSLFYHRSGGKCKRISQMEVGNLCSFQFSPAFSRSFAVPL